MGMQILQVVLAPIPGEATGFIGGYLFGSIKGFIYSSLASGQLDHGSILPLAGIWESGSSDAGYRLINGHRFDHLLKRQGHYCIAHPFYLSRVSQRLPVPCFWESPRHSLSKPSC